MRHVDLVHIDLKHMDPERHRVLTGHSNQPILENLEKLRHIKSPEEVIVRIPVIPGCNDSVENLTASGRFLARLGFTQIELIPYHRFGVSKYEQYGMLYGLRECEALDQAKIHPLRAILERFG